MTDAPRYRTGNAELDGRIGELVDAADLGRDRDLVFEMIVSAVRMGRESADRGDLKLVNSTLKELRYSFLVFEPYESVRKAAIFGSARTPPGDPAYQMAHDFGRAITEHDWMVITGAGPGIMEAGIEGAGADKAFGVNIVLPFETGAAPVIANDPKLINYRYFFTRKLTFMKEAHAFALAPGGFGTMDEAFELLTLMQTGRSPVTPVVMLEPEGSTYWQAWHRFVSEDLGSRGLISESDFAFTRICSTVDEAVDEIRRFYTTFHSYRFVGRRTVMRLQREIGDDELDALNRDFADIVVSGRIDRAPASQPELDDDDVTDLPRLSLAFDKMSYTRLRQLIDQLNEGSP